MQHVYVCCKSCFRSFFLFIYYLLFIIYFFLKRDSVECRYVLLIMTSGSCPSLAVIHFFFYEYSTLLHAKFYISGRPITFTDNIAKTQLDKFRYSSVSELQSFPTLSTRLLGFRHRVHRDRKIIQFCLLFSQASLFGFRLNCKQHVMPHQGIKSWLN